MTTGLYKKGLVFAVIVLFVGVGVVPSISGNEEYDELTLNLDQLDQYQTEYSQYHGIPSYLAQSFTPTLSSITRVKLFGYQHFDNVVNLRISIRDDLDGEDLTYCIINKNALPPDGDNGEWFNCDFPDKTIIPGEKYYIVWYSYGEPTIFWGQIVDGNTDYYPYGDGHFFHISENCWYRTPNSDNCFKTYGPGSDELEIIIDKINGGFRVSADIKNTGEKTATNVEWSIDLEGGLILAGEHTEGVIDELAPGATKTIRQATLYGISMTTITVTAGDAEKQATGFILGPLVLNVQEI